MKIIYGEQYDARWRQARRGKPTASDAKRIITPAKGELSRSETMRAYACQLIADLYDPNYFWRDDTYVSAAMKNGSMMEPEARRYYEMNRGVDVEQVCFCLSDCERFGCSPDGLVGTDGGLEAKSPEPHTHVSYLLGKVLPVEYKPQVHFCLAVTGRAWWDFLSYRRGFPPLLVRVEPDDYTERVRDAIGEFLSVMDDIKRELALGDPPPNTIPDELAMDYEPVELPAALAM